MARHKKKEKFPKLLLLISAILIIYLKVRDYLIVGSLSCGLGFNPCPSISRFLLELFLWIIIIFIILFLVKFFARSILHPEKKVKKNLMLKRANEQAHKAKKKKKAKKAKKKEKAEENVEEEAADINGLDENDTWNEVEVESEKKDEVIRI